MEENEALDLENLIEFEGFIRFYKFEDEASGYRIASFKIDDNKQERNIIITGYFPHYSTDEAVVIKTKQITHPKYGIQFEVKEIFKRLPTTKENIIRFLSGSNFKGIGVKKATDIYNELGDETISLLVNDESKYIELFDKKIINEKQLIGLKNGLKNFDFKSNAFQKLLKYGFTLKNIMKAEAVYGEELTNIIDINPYQLIIDIDGIGFKTVDKMAISMGIDPYDSRRVKSAIIFTLVNLCNSTGDTYISIDKLYKNVYKFINVENQIFNDYIFELKKEGKVFIEDNNIYYEKLYNAEYSIVNKLKPFIKRKINTDLINLHFDNLIKQIEEDDGITYSNEQTEAIYNALVNGLFIITGGPGTGKTTILNAIIKIMKMIYGEDFILSLCAPTGRASKRMSMLSKNYACTIHRLLKWDLHSNSFAYNEDNKLHCDVIIIDEFSMVDTLLFDSLLKGTVNVSQIILIGDDGQIPSVSAGNLLYDFLHIPEIQNIKLNKIYRQENGSKIVDLAYAIRHKDLDESFNFKEDVKFFKIKNNQACEFVISILKKAFENGFSFDDFQIICPMYGTICGIDNLNAAIQNWYNPASDNKNEIRVGHQVIRENDRVLQLKNQPEDDVFNGDIGEVIEIDNQSKEILVQFDSGVVVYPLQMHANLTLAYAISIHKSQGSEFNFVIMTIFNDYGFFLNQQLIYTAVSRAKRQLYILGDYHTFLYKARVENKAIRKTTIIKRAQELL